MVASSVAKATAKPVATTAANSGSGISAWQALLGDADLLFRLNGDANADGTGDPNDWAGNWSATWSGTPAYGTAPTQTDGKSFVLDGSTNDLRQGTTVLGYYTNNFSIACWLKLNAFGGRIATVRNDPGPAWDFYTGGFSNLELYDGASAHQSAGALTTRSWIHVGFVINGSASKFFINGVQSGADFNPSIAGYAGAVPFTWGSLSWLGIAYFDGELADCRMYSRALTADEFSTLYVGQ